MPIKTIFVTLFSSFPQGSASASSLTSITAWKTCLKGWPFTASTPLIRKIVPHIDKSDGGGTTDINVES